ncbi:MAG: hypothetical protein JWP35_4665 [Caulobacter sp.]|nr:hypothetical protein [Caulobacter sp.]
MTEAPEATPAQAGEQAGVGDLTRDIPALRLNLLRLVHRHDQEPKTAIERAKVLEAYVLADDSVKPGRKAPAAA